MTDAGSSRYFVGIDLGTSNCAVAFVEPALGAGQPVHDLAIPQLVRPGEVAFKPLLPSCLYLPNPHEFPAGSLNLPWGNGPLKTGSPTLTGELARAHGAKVPARLVTSAKSWLCHPGVDRTAPILPWGAAADVRRLSPVDASATLLAHIAAAWNHAHPEAPLSRQEVCITVPASFDEAARALTVDAARQAGLEHFTLLEEPQAAFYDFAARHRENLERTLEGMRLILVVDVGGGTSDFTLIQAGQSANGPVLRRIAVGDHLILGGDNMDTALARLAEEKMTAGKRSLSSVQLAQLVQAGRLAKELLLSDGQHDHYRLAIAGEGSRLIGSALSAEITQAEADQIVLDGFLPRCGPEDAPRQTSGRMALQELGLPYAQDPAITRHLASFLRTHARDCFAALAKPDGGNLLPRPDGLLLNGGVFNSSRIARRLEEVLSSWWPDFPPVPLLRHESLDLAVARGAAYFGLAKHGLTERIAGGSAHALFVGLDSGSGKEDRGLCVIPRGQPEGQPVDVGERPFHLALGRPVQFPLYSTAAQFEKPGDVVPLREDMKRLPPIHAFLKSTRTRVGKVPVHLRASLTEIGTLELWCVSNRGDDRWRLEFELRGTQGEAATGEVESTPPGFAQAKDIIVLFFPGRGLPAPQPIPDAPKNVKQIWPWLERLLGAREGWRLPVLREIAGVLLAGAQKRRRSVDHERVYCQLLGFALRPGLGYPLDDWRCEQAAKLFGEGIHFHDSHAVWHEFWVLWRRLAGGMSPQRHQEIWDYLKPHLARQIPPKPSGQLAPPKGVRPLDPDEMTRLAASLEHLEASDKVELGGWIASRLAAAPAENGPWAWALGRLGARVPVYSSAHRTVPPEISAHWISLLLDPTRIQLEGAAFAVARLAQLTGDRARDVPEDLRARVAAALEQRKSPPAWSRMVTEALALDPSDNARVLGDTVPPGLSLG
jgi:molecular chaperone DnaK (HSP70)